MVESACTSDHSRKSCAYTSGRHATRLLDNDFSNLKAGVALETLILTGTERHVDSAVLGHPSLLQQLQLFRAVTLSTQPSWTPQHCYLALGI